VRPSSSFIPSWVLLADGEQEASAPERLAELDCAVLSDAVPVLPAVAPVEPPVVPVLPAVVPDVEALGLDGPPPAHARSTSTPLKLLVFISAGAPLEVVEEEALALVSVDVAVPALLWVAGCDCWDGGF